MRLIGFWGMAGDLPDLKLTSHPASRERAAASGRGQDLLSLPDVQGGASK